ncbi:MAG: PEP-CTERM sorting domain-containing protein [Crocosphaera sp.]|nr:PEP-CTERM sorting domain-containing protein [Crocosphaera sp.]
MKKLPITRITAGILGLTSAATLGVAQQAQAGTVKATADLTVTDVTVELTNVGGTSSVIPLFFETVNGVAEVGPFPGKPGEPVIDAYAEGPVQCPVNLVGGASASIGPNVTNSGSSVNCLTNTATVTAFANTMLTDNGSSNGIGAYTIFTGGFPVAVGDFVDFNGLLNLVVEAEISGYDEGEMKTAAADFLGTYEIFVDNELVFAGPELDFAVALVNQNGFEVPAPIATIPPTPFPLENFSVDDLPNPTGNPDGPVDYTFVAADFANGTNGNAEIQFSVRQQVSASNMQDAPEPSAVISLAAVGVGALISRKRKNSAK